MNSRRHGNSDDLRNNRLLPLLSVLLFFTIPVPAQAHPESLSNLRLVLGARELHATLTLPVRDLTGWFPPGRYHNYIADVVGELQKEEAGLLEVSFDDGAALTPLNVAVHPGKPGFILADFRYGVPAEINTLVVRTAEIGNLPNDHQQVVWVEDERAGAAASRVVAEQVLNAQQDTLSVELPDAPTTTQPAVVAQASSPNVVSTSTSTSISTPTPAVAPAHPARRALLMVAPAALLAVLFGIVVVLRRPGSVSGNASDTSTFI
jgi:hypothetical protein